MYALYSKVDITQEVNSITLMLSEYYNNDFLQGNDIGDTLFRLSTTKDGYLYTEWIDLIPLPNINIEDGIVPDGFCFGKTDDLLEMPPK